MKSVDVEVLIIIKTNFYTLFIKRWSYGSLLIAFLKQCYYAEHEIVHGFESNELLELLVLIMSGVFCLQIMVIVEEWY